MGIEHFNHLVLVLQRYHQVQTNMAGNKIAGLNVQWDCPSKQVHINIRSYVKDLLLSLNWPMPKKPQLSPFTTTPIAYDQKTQFTPDEDTSAPCCQNISSAFKKLLGPYFIMQELLITACWLHAMPSAHDKLRQHYTLNHLSKCS
jgi:hypothetical protein